MVRSGFDGRIPGLVLFSRRLGIGQGSYHEKQYLQDHGRRASQSATESPLQRFNEVELENRNLAIRSTTEASAVSYNATDLNISACLDPSCGKRGDD